jgi:catechol 2,3-dioxygenase-like lactoylglutathione lyase family enzyme
MSVIKAFDLAYGRLTSPDLDRQEAFLTDFGMVRADRTKTALYMRGTDAPHHIHVTGLGEPRYVGIAVHAAGMEDLDRISRVAGASAIEDIDEPGGGRRVRLTDPDGYQVEVVHGMAALEPIPVNRPAVNSGGDKLRRKGELFRIERGPSHIKRFGHFVIMSKNFEKTLGWYREMLGFRCSDEVYEGERSHVVGSFNRLDRGDEYVDHHAFFCIRGEKSGLNHLSFEAADIDDILVGHEHLQGKGYKHMWGLGRHKLGSQFFDYWADPWGRVHEHWADTDVLNARTPPNFVERGPAIAGPWGQPIPEVFRGHASP